MLMIKRAFAALLGSLLPLVVGAGGLVVLALDLFDFARLPAGYEQEILLLAASTVLLGYFAAHSTGNRAADGVARLEGTVNGLEGRLSEALGGVRQIPSGDIRAHLIENARGVTAFYFRGGSGRWLRRFTLPTLGSVKDRDVQVSVQLLDPRDEELCREYARYRAASRRPGDVRPDEDNPRLIQRDILGSVYATAWYSARARLQAEVVLLRAFSPARYDVSSEGAVVSVSDPAAPGLLAKRGSWLHAAFVDEMCQARHGHGVATAPGDLNHFPPDIAAVDGDVVRDALTAFTVTVNGTAPSALLTGYASSGVDWALVAAEHVHG
jgi:hypothetical protein